MARDGLCSLSLIGGQHCATSNELNGVNGSGVKKWRPRSVHPNIVCSEIQAILRRLLPQTLSHNNPSDILTDHMHIPATQPTSMIKVNKNCDGLCRHTKTANNSRARCVRL